MRSLIVAIVLLMGSVSVVGSDPVHRTAFDHNKEIVKNLLYCDLVECVTGMFNTRYGASTRLYYQWRYAMLAQHYYYNEIKADLFALIAKAQKMRHDGKK